MELQVIPLKGYQTWWGWVIRDEAGVVVEESTIQFRSEMVAEERGRHRITQLCHSREDAAK